MHRRRGVGLAHRPRPRGVGRERSARAREHRVFARDRWRCTVPGCTSYRNLHDHHVVFRSAGGDDELANRTTLCAYHHLRGVHAGRVRVLGTAPDRLRFELGLRPGLPAAPRLRLGRSSQDIVRRMSPRRHDRQDLQWIADRAMRDRGLEPDFPPRRDVRGRCASTDPPRILRHATCATCCGARSTTTTPATSTSSRSPNA